MSRRSQYLIKCFSATNFWQIYQWKRNETKQRYKESFLRCFFNISCWMYGENNGSTAITWWSHYHLMYVNSETHNTAELVGIDRFSIGINQNLNVYLSALLFFYFYVLILFLGLALNSAFSVHCMICVF